MFEGIEIWKFIAGLGIFLFGMFMLEEGIKNLSGRAFKKFIRKHTQKPIKSILSGTILTAILQSSSLVTLMLLAFVGAGIVTLSNAIGVILGSNLGTTMTGWIVASLGFHVNIESFALPFVGIGGLGLIFLAKSDRLSNISKIVVGFGFIFLGLEYMKLSMASFAESFDVSVLAGYGTFVFLFAGFVVTAIIQSSSATMVIILSALSSGIIDFESSAAMVIGSDLGTTITALLGGLGGTIVKRQVAFSHFLFNLVTDLVAYSLLGVLIYIVKDIYSIEDDLMGLVALHSTFNLLGILMFLPFIKSFASLMKRMFKEKDHRMAQYIAKVSTQVPEASLKALRDECVLILKLSTYENSNLFGSKEQRDLLKAEFDGLQKSLIERGGYREIYDGIKHLEGEMIDYYMKIQQQKLTEEESLELNRLVDSIKYSAVGLKSIKDIKHNLVDFSGSLNSLVHNEQKEMFKRQKRFYKEFYLVLKNIDTSATMDNIVDLYLMNKELNSEFVLHMTENVNSHQISKIEISTLFNVNREVYESNKALLKASENLIKTSNVQLT